jgi:hypothetical protein
MKKSSFRLRARCAALAIAAVAATITTASAFAIERHPGPWHGDIHQFHEHDWGVWRGGHWFHGPHNGRMGWWWIAGGTYYFYPAPVYPYPSPWEPPAVELVTPPANSPPPATQYWYFCQASNSYYPYVATCPGGWQQVPATPSPTPTPAPPR